MLKNIHIFSLLFFVVATTTHAQMIKVNKSILTGVVKRYNMFGSQVSQDDQFVFIASPKDNLAVKNAGALHIYKKTGNQLTFIQVISAEGASPYTHFGKIFAHEGRYLVIGSSFPVNTAKGKSYLSLYKFSGQTWQWVNIVRPSVFQIQNLSPVSISINGNTIAIGNPSVSKNYPNGCVEIYHIDTTTDAVIFDQVITPTNWEVFSSIGQQVCIDGNYLAISAVGHRGNALRSGTVLLFQNGPNGWNEINEIKPSDGEQDDHFGYSLSLDNHFLAVGAIRQGVSTMNGKKCGAVYIYRIQDQSLFYEAKLQPDAGANDYDYFGHSVKLHDNTLVVGSPGSDFAATNGGVIYVFQRINNSWRFQNKLISMNPRPNGYSGASVSVYLDQVLFSSHLEEDDSSLVDHGSVYYTKVMSTGVPEETNENHRKGEWILYPIPARETLHVIVSNQDDVKQIQLFDLHGQELTEYIQEVHSDLSNERKYQINCAHLPTGLYLLKSDNGLVKKFVHVQPYE